MSGMVPKNRISARQDWDCEAALDQKAEDLSIKTYELEEELRVVLALRYHDGVTGSNEGTSNISASHAWFDYITAFLVIGGLLGLFALAVVNAGK